MANTSDSLRAQAWVYYEQGPLAQTLQKTTLTVDTQLGANEVLVEVKAVALNPVDIQLGNIPQWMATWLLAAGVNKAKVPAGDFSGIIVRIGEEVSKYKTGDEVFGLSMSIVGNGCLVQYMKIAESMPSMTFKPACLSHLEAAAMPLVFLTAYTALHYWGGWRETEADDRKVLILGASGGVGHVACQLARAMQSSVVGVCSGRNIDFVKEMGANEVIDYTVDDLVTQSEQCGPYDLILDCVGGKQLIPHLHTGLLKPKAAGYITIVGDKTSRDLLGGMASYLFTPSMVLRTMKSWLGLGPRYYCINLSTTAEYTATMSEMLGRGLVKPIIDSVFRFSDQAKQAYERLDTGRAQGKIVIDLEK